MATPPVSTSLSSPLRKAPTAAAAWAISLLLAAGCSQPPAGRPSGSASPPATSLVSPSPGTAGLPGELSYDSISKDYQAPVADAQNGWPLLKPLLVPADPNAPLPSERLGELDLSNPGQLAYFDKEVLPKLKKAFSKPSFVEVHPLLAGRDPLGQHYRAIRRLCDLVGQRADLLWRQGKKEQALDLLRLPLSLSKALQSRPETVSVNDFSSSYAGASLRELADWAADNSLEQPELGQAARMLAEYRPSYRHVVDSISVDFAQLENSIDDETTRTDVLGLGLARPEDLKTWKVQLRSLRSQARKLYALQPGDPEVFNDVVSKTAPQVHGLVLDYPLLTTMQKRAYASYLATELALALEGRRLAGDKTPLQAKPLIEKTFAGDQEAQQAAAALLQIQPGVNPGRFSIVGRADVFGLISPEQPPVFYQR